MASAFVSSISLLVFHFYVPPIVICDMLCLMFFLKLFILNLFIYKKSKNNIRQVMIGKIWRKTPSLLLRNPQKMELSRLSMIGRSFPSGETTSSTLRAIWWNSFCYVEITRWRTSRDVGRDYPSIQRRVKLWNYRRTRSISQEPWLQSSLPSAEQTWKPLNEP